MNPPFVPEVLTAAAERAESLLAAAEESGGRLSFVVVVPAWRDVPMWRALDESRTRLSPPTSPRVPRLPWENE